MRKVLQLFCAGAMVATAFAMFSTRTTPAKAQTAVPIAVLLPDSASSDRWETDDRKYLQADFDAAGIKANIVNAQNDPNAQITQADQAITNGAKVILLVDLDFGSGAAIIAKAREAKVAIIDYDRLTIQGPGADFYVSFDNVEVGKLQGQGLVAAVKAAGIKNPKVAELNGSPTDNNATLFAEGYNSVLDPLYKDSTSGWTKIADQSVPGWDNQQALTIFEQILTKNNGKVDAAIAANDGIAGSVIAALANQGLAPIPVTGQDATVGGIQYILAGKQSMTVYKPIQQEADAAAKLAIALVNGTDTAKLTTSTIDQTAGGKNTDGNKALPAVLLTPYAVTKANIADTVIKDKFRTWAEICVGDFAQYCPPDALSGTPAATMSATMAATVAK